MNSLIKRYYSERVLWSFLMFLMRIIRGPLTIYFVVSNLTLNDQGVYYSFMSLGAMAVLAELGFTRLVSVYLSHEYSRLRFKSKFLVGSLIDRIKLFSLITFTLICMTLIMILATVILIPTGEYLFRDQSDDVRLAWYWFAGCSALQLLSTFFQAISIGFDHIKISSKNAIYSGIIGTLSLWLGLNYGLGIYALAISFSISFLTSFYLFYRNYRCLITQWGRYKFTLDKAYMGKFLRVQLKYAVGFAAGWVAFQLYTPALFEYFGAAFAGKFGLTVSVLYLLVPFGSIFFNSFSAKITILIANQSFQEARSITKKMAVLGLLAFLAASIFVLILVSVLLDYPEYSDRILSIDVIVVFILSEVATYTYGILGVYTRLHKIDVFYKLSLIQAPMIIAMVIVVLPQLSIFSFFALIASLQWFLFLPIAFYLFLPYWRLN